MSDGVEAQLAQTSEDFLLFTSTVCPYCISAKRRLDGAGLSFREINIDIEPGMRAAVVSFSGHRTVPVIYDLRSDDPVFVGGADNLMAYL